MDSICIEVNGIRIECEKGESLLSVCLNNGIYIPHLCNHPDLEAVGGCALCLVDVEGETECRRACTLATYDGMKVTTESERISSLRRLSMEIILSEHPEDCSSCPVFGNCVLQSVIQYVGASNGRFRSLEKHSGVNSSNPLFVHDMYRCIKCGRCVRACRDLRGVGVMKFKRDAQGDVIVGFDGDSLQAADCRFCGACVEVCPTGALRDKENAVDLTATSMSERLLPCSAKCPAHVDIPRYIRHIKNGEDQLALNTIREKVAFPASLGFVCRHFCEEACRRQMVNEAVSVRELKKYVALNDDGSWKQKLVISKPNGKRIAIIGAGPAGLTAALDLLLRGFSVTVYEKEAEAGGMLRYGIPEYRLPAEIVRKETEEIKALGVEIIANRTIDKPQELLEYGYDAVILAVGAQKSVIPSIDGSDKNGVMGSIEFLHSLRDGKRQQVRGSVAVIGGGNVALDCATSAKRLGADKVTLVVRKPKEQLRCDKEELQEALDAGVEICELVNFVSIAGNECAQGVVVQPVNDGEEFIVEASTVVFAIGQYCADVGVRLTERGFVAVDSSLHTEERCVFAIGDAVTGTKSVIEAIAAGHRVADEVTKNLGLECVPTAMAGEKNRNANIGKQEGFSTLKRITPSKPCVQEKQGYCTFSCDEARSEASRCLQCDLRLEISRDRLWTEFKKDGEVADTGARYRTERLKHSAVKGEQWDNCITPPDEGACPAGWLLEKLEAAREKSCGECEVCRLGIRQLCTLTKAVTEGEASAAELDNYIYVANGMKKLSACEYGSELGKAIEEYYEKYKESFEQHVSRKKCVALTCKGYITYHVLPAVCNGCGECKSVCPSGAILGESGEIHVIDKLECTKCGKCMELCNQNAVVRAGALKPKTPREPIPVGKWKR